MARGMSRRTLLTGGMLAAAGAVMAPALSACAQPQEGQTAGQNREQTNAQAGEGSAKGRPSVTHDIDVVIVGGGISGCFAAMNALELGSSVAVIDKGQWGHSGTSGYNWGHMYTSYDETTDPEASLQTAVFTKIRGGSGVSDQDTAAVLGATIMDMHLTHTCESFGMVHERLEDGSPGTCFWGNPMKGDTSNLTQGIYCRFINQRVQAMGAQVYDRTMLLDVIVGEDASGQREATGAVALDLRNGVAHIFRAKSVILAMGSYNWMCGWLGWRPQSMCGPECTGDAYSILMQNGVPVGNFEFCSIDNNMYNPGAFRLAFGLGLEYPDADRGLNADGRRFCAEYIAEHSDQSGIETLEQLVAGEVFHGRGSEHGGVYLDLKDFGGQEMEVFYRRTVDNLKRNFGYEVPEVVEVVPDPWASYCSPRVDATMQTTIAGLYFSGYPVVSGGVEGCAASGQIAGQNAALRSATADRAALDWEQAAAAVEHAWELLERAPEDGIMPTQLMREIQTNYQANMGLLRDEASLRAALDELNRIRTEDLPRMAFPSNSVAMNLEWRHALEAEHLLNSAIGAAMGALERRESRYMHVRTDYPALNNDEFLKKFMISMDGGEFVLDAVDVDMSVADAQTLAALVPSTNINSYNEMLGE